MVANPGHLAWMSEGARALAEAGLLHSYITPLATRPNGSSAFGRIPLPDSIRRAIDRELSRRGLPDDLPPARVRRIASGVEAASVLAGRLGLSGSPRRALADVRDRAFDHSVARLLTSRDRVVLAAYGAAERTLERAHSLGATTYVEYAIHHHRFAESLLREEMAEQPAYASTLQFHEVSGRRRERVEAEIESSDRLIVPSTFSLRTFADQGVEASKLRCVNFGVDTKRFSPRESEVDSTFRVLFVGVFSQRKGVSYLIDGFKRAELPHSELMMVGRPIGSSVPWRSERDIRESSWRRGEELVRLYQSASVFVLPSLIEGFARVVLEAMACGVPVVVTPNTGAEDVVSEGNEGFVVPIRDADAIAERLRHLYENPSAREQMGRAARRTAEQNTWDEYGARLVRTLVGE